MPPTMGTNSTISSHSSFGRLRTSDSGVVITLIVQ